MLEALIFVVFPFCMLFAAISDALSMTIANRVSLVLVVTFVVVAPLTGMALSEFGLHLAAGAAVLVVTFGLFALGGMGGGDAKLLAATSVWMGFNISLVEYLVTSSILGGLLTMAILVYRRSPLAIVTRQNQKLRADLAAGDPEARQATAGQDRAANAVLREQIAQIAAEMAHLVEKVEGKDSPILRLVPPGEPATSTEGELSLADRIRALRAATSS